MYNLYASNYLVDTNKATRDTIDTTDRYIANIVRPRGIIANTLARLEASLGN